MSPRPSPQARSATKKMNTLAYDQRATSPEGAGDPLDSERLPRRPRRRYLNKRSLALTAALTCAAGFYAGVRVEKGQFSGTSSTSGSSALSALAARFRSGAGAARGTGAGAGAGAAGGGFAGAAGAGGASGSSFGTIASVNGRTLYVSDATGNTIKVRLSSTTKLTKSLAVARSSLHPGDTVVIRGVKNSSGTLVAATVSDTGAGATSSSGSGGSGSSGSSGSGSSGGGSGLSSLFSSGG